MWLFYCINLLALLSKHKAEGILAFFLNHTMKVAEVFAYLNSLELFLECNLDNRIILFSLINSFKNP